MPKLTELKNREEYTYHILVSLKNNDQEQFMKDFLAFHPVDQAQLFSTVQSHYRQKIYAFLHPEMFALIFQELAHSVKVQVLDEMESQYAQRVLQAIPADDLVAFLKQLPENEAEWLLNVMLENASKIKRLLAFQKETAGALMTFEYMAVSPFDKVEQVLQRIKCEGKQYETVYYLYVLDECGHLVGVISLRDLVVHPKHFLIDSIMNKHVVTLNLFDSQEHVIMILKKYNLLAVPVVNREHKLIGIITFDDVMDVLEEVATEEISDISAVRGGTDVNISSFTLAKRRAPWIILLMFLGMITASVIGQYEEILASIVILAAFIPLIMDSAGNTGTQSLAVVVRGLATGTVERIGVKRLLSRELITGLTIGLICGVILFTIVSLAAITFGVFDEAKHALMLAFIISFSIFISISVSTLIGAVVPLIVNKLKIDPAIASGPFITTINDIIGLMVYFTIATALLPYF